MYQQEQSQRGEEFLDCYDALGINPYGKYRKSELDGNGKSQLELRYRMVLVELGKDIRLIEEDIGLIEDEIQRLAGSGKMKKLRRTLLQWQRKVSQRTLALMNEKLEKFINHSLF